MLAEHDLVAFIATRDVTVARTFYERTLGLEVVSEDDFALVCSAHGTTLRIQKVDGFRPQPFTVLGWRVPDLRSSIEQLRERGVTFERYEGMDQDALGIWTSPSGARVAWCRDPDGNTLSLTQT